ncbi:MAG: SIS domain-containing protein [Acidimicrobiia bacterium]|nr:SIS domain-containing protein [Acidimicrobiia bacterium]
MPTTYSKSFIEETIEILGLIPTADVDAVVDIVVGVRERGGRLFFCGSGGGAGHSSHAASDFRKLGRVESYSVTDNVSELTARINDDGWEDSYASWLRGSSFGPNDCLFVFSVGGGDVERNISVNLVNAMLLAQEVGAPITGIVGRDGGAVKQWADACINVPTVNDATVTAQTEGLQSLFWHLIVTHPALSPETPKWESTH